VKAEGAAEVSRFVFRWFSGGEEAAVGPDDGAMGAGEGEGGGSPGRALVVVGCGGGGRGPPGGGVGDEVDGVELNEAAVMDDGELF
jgi:hypothetical protein